MNHITYDQFTEYSINQLVAADRRPLDEFKAARGYNYKKLAPSATLEFGLKQYYGHPDGKGPPLSPPLFAALYIQELNRRVKYIRNLIAKGTITPDTIIVGWGTDDGRRQTEVFCEFINKILRHG